MTYRLIPYSQVLVIFCTAQQPTPENYSWPYEYWHIWLHPAYEARGWICIHSEMYSQFGGREEPELSSQISPECTNVWAVPDHQLFSHHSDKTLKSVQKQFRFINSFAQFHVDIFTHLFYSSANHSRACRAESANCIRAQYLHHLRWRLQHILGKLDSVWVLGLSSRGDMGHRTAGECRELEDCKLATFVPGIVLQCISFY